MLYINQMHSFFIKVSLIDYGSCEIINISQLRKLPKQFWKTPKAALCCALANIRPTGKEFTAASADALVDLADGQKMFAKILRIDNIVSVNIKNNVMNSY